MTMDDAGSGGVERSDPATGMASRKLRHIDACLHGPVEYETVTTGFERYRLPYNALTQTNLGTVDLSTGFLGAQLRAPVLIGAMTGGAELSRTINRNLAEAAQKLGIGMMLGSQRIMLDDADGTVAASFSIRDLAPDVLLVGNIDWGGVFAQLVGTMELLESDERELVRGFLINKFRGDKTLLDSGIRWLEERCGRPVMGVIPYFPDVELLEEDSVPEQKRGVRVSEDQIRIEVIDLPRISNFTDFAPLERELQVSVRYLDRPPADRSLPDCVILPGSKSTMADLAFVRERRWDQYLGDCVEAKREVIGICGGFQMLGQQILDP
ncbi:MAG: alpha-hydroxy-acid oxidizing protein, partial [Mycolicibacterium aromaticivorans]|nr:alpha-hydroxy-acid oxidizing protein [Mycolicibacterium aromaticivorans]